MTFTASVHFTSETVTRDPSTGISTYRYELKLGPETIATLSTEERLSSSEALGILIRKLPS